MSEIATVIQTTDKGDLLVTWPDVTEADTFAAYDLEEAVSEISIQIGGTFGSATVVIQGSNDATSYVDLMQMNGLAASALAADLFSILDRPMQIKPSTSGGSSQSSTVTMLVRR